MRVLVTGGAGLIGMALREALPELGHHVVAVDITDFGRPDVDLIRMPLSDHKGLEALICEQRIDAIVHSGGVSGPVMMRDDPVAIVETNVTSTAVLLDIARRRSLSRLILLSSHVVYGDTGLDLIHESRSLAPGSTYAASKIAGEALVESFRREWDLSAASLRLTRVYGPHRRADCFLRQVLIDHAVGRPTTIPCDPDFPYHYLYVGDIVSAVAATLAAPVLHHANYNVTSGEVVTMPQVAAILRATLSSACIDLVPGRDDAPEVQADFALDWIAADTGWRPAYPLARGFAEYAARFASDPHTVN